MTNVPHCTLALPGAHPKLINQIALLIVYMCAHRAPSLLPVNITGRNCQTELERQCATQEACLYKSGHTNAYRTAAQRGGRCHCRFGWSRPAGSYSSELLHIGKRCLFCQRPGRPVSVLHLVGCLRKQYRMQTQSSGLHTQTHTHTCAQTNAAHLTHREYRLHKHAPSVAVEQ